MTGQHTSSSPLKAAPAVTPAQWDALQQHHHLRENATLASIRATRAQLGQADASSRNDAPPQIPAHLRPIWSRWGEILAAHPTSDPVPTQSEAAQLWHRVVEVGAGLLAKAGWDEEQCAHERALDEFFASCSDQLPQLLSGEHTVQQLLFAQDSLDAAAALYATNPLSREINTWVADRLAQQVSKGHSGRPLIVVDIGAGTGALADPIMDALGDKECVYLFSDVSRWFLHRARVRYSGRAGLHTAVIDINASLEARISQALADAGLPGGQVDAVVCGNVLHNAVDVVAVLQDLGAVLAEDGRLYVVETGTEHLPLQISMRFLMATNPAVCFHDARADSGRIFLSAEEWGAAATAAGLVVCEHVPTADHPAAWVDQFCMVCAPDRQQPKHRVPLPCGGPNSAPSYSLSSG
ncbi:hypothetical protein C1Y63_00835 [Corynebacterium sp. 13CS0277]|uniref:class I SAM-dependent methyltransferase n=1 Tax=Corynebacterium sp. 13CS0277 TaxID=2071994 RepID=UPI000D03BF05|nr:class I SAM-dependent methyltransferase [Corynebacterium sp. 13CS0277]PRQ12371.1 hypothetical protein C1Y63_00835 [Corynebacterium sp. 13CS0277]